MRFGNNNSTLEIFSNIDFLNTWFTYVVLEEKGMT